MPTFRYGPVELYLIGFEGESPDPRTVQAVADLADKGIMRVLDLLIISKSESGDVEVVEVEQDDLPIDLLEVGIAGEEDIADLAELVPPGGSAALIAVELVYARELAERLNGSGAVMLSAERIPAPVVNAMLDVAEQV